MKVLLGFLAISALCVQSASAIGNDPIPGTVIAIQTFDDFLGFNPHCHILLTDSCFLW